MAKTLGLLCIASLPWLLVFAGCGNVVSPANGDTSGSAATTSSGGGEGGAVGEGGAAGQGGVAGSGGEGGATGQGGAAGSGGQGGNGTGGEGGGACMEVTTQAAPSPLTLIFLLDRSGSMIGLKWDGATDAIKMFANAAVSAGIQVGLSYFPIDDIGVDACSAATYTPLAVPLGVLPAAAPALVMSIDNEDPLGGGSPLRAALEAALFAATAHADADPTGNVAVVLVTDEGPLDCGPNPQAATEALAKSALDYNSVRTYVLAVQGASLAPLDLIAAAGGTGAALSVGSSIADAALGCDFALPGGPLDLAQVNVSFVPGGMGAPIMLGHAANAADCGAGPGWYYHNPGGGSVGALRLCPASCGTAQANPGTQAFVSVGCTTINN